MLDLTILEILVVAAGVVSPIYFWLRRRMTFQLKHENAISYYTKRRITHFYLFTVTILIFTFFVTLLLIIGIKSRNTLNYYSNEEIAVIVIYIIRYDRGCT